MVLKIFSIFLILLFVNCNTIKSTPNNKLGEVFFSISSNGDINIRDVIIIEIPSNKDGKFINNSDAEIIKFIEAQEELTIIDINVKLNSNEKFNKKYSEGLKSSLIMHIKSNTNLILNEDYKIRSLGSSEKLIILNTKKKLKK